MTKRLLSACLVFAGMYTIEERRAAGPSSSDDVSRFDSRRRRPVLRSVETDLALLRR